MMKNIHQPHGKWYRRIPRGRALFILTILLVICSIHWLLPISPPAFHAAHVVLRKMFLVPIVLAGAWFGVRGAVISAAASTLLYGPHIFFTWPGQTSENLNQVTDVALFWIVGVFAGWLFERAHTARRRAEQAHKGLLESLASALDAREHETHCHSERVADLAVRIGTRLGLREQQIHTLRDAARLHDVGKIGVPDQILLKPGPLDDKERQVMQTHAEIGSRIVGRLPSLRAAANLILCHHERFDGAGYPRGLRGQDIPLSARVFTVADVYDALTTDRPYRDAMPHEQAMAMIRNQGGYAFDREVVKVFENIVSGPNSFGPNSSTPASAAGKRTLT